MKDIIGNEFDVGDMVATDVTWKKSSALRVGKVTEVDDKGHVKVFYPVESGWGSEKKMINRSVWRRPSGVIKAASQ